jgi:hypothetical protein
VKTIFTFFLTLFFIGTVNAQCYSVNQVAYNYDSIASPDSVILMDDQYSELIPIGFPFCFYGGSYDSLLIGSNGVLSFDTSQAMNYCQWPIPNPIPSSSNPYNAIFLPWQDLCVPLGGKISYQTIGSFPNRKFIVDFSAVPMYSCTTNVFTGQVKLYETSNVVEIDIAQKLICAWNGGYAIEGIQDRTTTMATVVPGRNYPSVWTANNDSWTFTPTCNVCVGVGINEPKIPELNLFVSDNNQISIIPNGAAYKMLGIYDILGQQMNFILTDNTISLATATPGIYIVTLEVNGARVTRKVMMN